MKAIVIAAMMLLAAGCSAFGTNQSATTETVSGVTSTSPATGSLLDEAKMCQGKIKYQIETLNGMIRSRLTCEWEASEEQWGEW